MNRRIIPPITGNGNVKPARSPQSSVDLSVHGPDSGIERLHLTIDPCHLSGAGGAMAKGFEERLDLGLQLGNAPLITVSCGGQGAHQAWASTWLSAQASTAALRKRQP